MKHPEEKISMSSFKISWRELEDIFMCENQKYLLVEEYDLYLDSMERVVQDIVFQDRKTEEVFIVTAKYEADHDGYFRCTDVTYEARPAVLATIVTNRYVSL